MTGSVIQTRYAHTATLLQDGRVLIAGGIDGTPITQDPLTTVGVLATAELYDPATGTWSPTGAMTTVRYWHTATLLPDGKVLVAGGVDGYHVVASAELYDPRTGAWTPTGSMLTPRWSHTATLLPDGDVLVTGGMDDQSNSLASAELYNPHTGTWTETGSMTTARTNHTATLLADGRVLVAGGGTYWVPVSTAEIYDPHTGIWTPTGAMTTPRGSHTATLLADGKVLVAGGFNDVPGPPTVLSSAELYDPATGTWQPTGRMTVPRYYDTATLLRNGRVLVAGGTGSEGDPEALASAELFDPGTGTWSATAGMTAAREMHTAVELYDGTVLVIGDFDFHGHDIPPSSTELYTPRTVLASPADGLTFGYQLVGTTGLPRIITITNTGASAAAITGITLGGSAPRDFSIISDTCANAALAAGAGCAIGIAFAPSTYGARDATLTISDSTTTIPQSIPLHGNGNSPETATPTATGTPSATSTTEPASAPTVLHLPDPSATATPSAMPPASPPEVAGATTVPVNSSLPTSASTPTTAASPVLPGNTATPFAPTASPRPAVAHAGSASLNMAVALPRSVVGGALLVVHMQTRPHVHVRAALQVVARRLVLTRSGKKIKRVPRTIVVYQVTSQRMADARGRATARLRVTYKPARSVRALLTVLAHSTRGAATVHKGWVVIQPAKRGTARAHRPPVPAPTRHRATSR